MIVRFLVPLGIPDLNAAHDAEDGHFAIQGGKLAQVLRDKNAALLVWLDVRRVS